MFTRPFPLLLRQLALGLLVANGVAVCNGAALNSKDVEFFEKKIRPVLVSECYSCHDAKKQKGGLRLDYRDALLKGGDTGPGLVPGDAKKSLLVQSITHEHEDLKMPKKGAKLDDAVIQDFITWVNRGAPDPRDQPSVETASIPWSETLAQRKQWWSFQPVKPAAVPAALGANASPHPVDRFLADKMAGAGLKPGPVADKRTLIRRATFTLTGLPPTPDEINAFLADTSPDAWSKVLDRLLASPRYGERWARHWMDLMRYAETHGSEGDPEIPLAWRYRDYLIRAFNADVPYDQLVREHLAGDLLKTPCRNDSENLNESTLGTAHFRLIEHGFQPIDTLDEQVKSVDNQIDVVSKAFLGLTISCARCHDHKFDAISQADFYALYGIFASVRPAQVTIDTPQQLGLHQGELATLKSRIRDSLADEWMKSADALPARLERLANTATRHQALKQRERELTQSLANLEFRNRLNPKATATNSAPAPLAWWSFESAASDQAGKLDGTLEGGAEIRNGRLVLNGTEAFVRTAPLKESLKEKTLEAWVALGTLDQGGGGVVTVESANGAVFDSIVYAERQPRRWMAGSNNGRRTRDVEGPAETAAANELIHIAIVYAGDSSITIYRNGQPYGASYKPEGNDSALREFASGDARLLFGRRHTGGGRAFLKGEIEEARLYRSALTPSQIAASFQAGTFHGSTKEPAQTLTPAEEARRQQLSVELATVRDSIAKLEKEDGPMLSTLAEAKKDASHPLHPWIVLSDTPASGFKAQWQDLVGKSTADSRPVDRNQFRTVWNLAAGDDAKWFRHGNGLSPKASPPGEFGIETEGANALTGLLPAGVYSHLISQKSSAVFTSPRFKIESDYISVRAMGGGGAAVRLIIDNYPLGINPTFPKAELNRSEPGWYRLDTAYRKGSWAYLEFSTQDDMTRPLSAQKNKQGTNEPDDRSWFGALEIVFHDSKEGPAESRKDVLALLDTAKAPASSRALAERYKTAIQHAVRDWKKGTATDAQVTLLDSLLRKDILPHTLNQLPALATLVAEYRKIEAAVPVPRRAPGVLEAVAYNQPLMKRGDHNTPGDSIPRRYLEAFDSKPYTTSLSGRLELADDIASATNPLTSRVMVNRLWQHVFGRGIVATVDNFGRLGEKPTHPELLDYLATHFVQDGWSVKSTLKFLMMSQAYQLESAPTEASLAHDPNNDLLSHMRLQRIEAESVRDSLLFVAGRLESQMYGAGDNAMAPADRQTRRSIYLNIRRNNLSPLLSVFDAPKPFTTQGRRDNTNVPAQSLAFLNDPFIIELAGQWAKRLIAANPTQPAEQRINTMFEQAFGRPATATELAASLHYLNDLAKDQSVAPEKLTTNEPVWQDFAQSLFNLKEFIYLK